MKKMLFKKRIKKSVAVITAVSLAVTTLAITAFADTDYSRSTRLTQPSYRYTFETGELAVVNFDPVWGDKETNVASMIEYVEEAAEAGVKILVFPELSVTGYVSSDDPESEEYQMIVENAEALDGETQQTFAALSDEYDMWIFYGAPEIVYNEDGSVDTEHAYDSTFACSPDGDVTAYQKISNEDEGDWCVAGETPVYLDAGDYGVIGISMGTDVYDTVELGRYYVAMGCNILVSPAAINDNYEEDSDAGYEWLFKNSYESTASRESYTILYANLVGSEGSEDEYSFPGGSVVMKGSPVYYAGVAEEDLGVTVGQFDEDAGEMTTADIVTGEEGLLTTCSQVSCNTGSTMSNSDFNPELYVTLYSRLAAKKSGGSSLTYSSSVTDGPKTAVVNMAAVWGDKEANVAAMTQYVLEAAAEGVEILVFPETVLCGYEYQEPEDGEDAMQVQLAETIPGKTTNYFSELAQEYDMYIIFGMPEKDEDGPIYEDGVEKVYNSAAICMPDGTITSYRKIHRAGYESKWSVPGEDPVILNTEWGKIGIDICRDGHFYPELGRYYAAMGCTLFIHPTATTGNPWYRETRIGSYTVRDGMAAITCNLLGGDGTYDAETDTWSGGIFSSTSLIITKYLDEDGNVSYDSETGYAINLNGTGTASETFSELGTSPEGLEIADMDLSGTGFDIESFNPELFAKMYDKLSTLYREGYVSVYGEDAVAEPETINLTDNPESSYYASAADTTADTATNEEVSGTTSADAATSTATNEEVSGTTSSVSGTAAKATKVKKATKKASSKTVTVKVKKIKSADYYQVQVSTSKNFKAKNIVAKKKSASTTIKISSKKLKNKKKLYVRVRTITKTDSGTVKSKWSSAKKVTVK